MKRSLNITMILVLGVIYLSQGQTTTAPTPKMTHPVYKSFLDLFMDYPDDALQMKKEGTVEIMFTTDPLGKVIDRQLQRGVYPSIDSTALAIFDLIQWNPAQKLGQNIKATTFFNLSFKKKKFLNLAKKRGYLHPDENYTPYDSSGDIYSLKKTEKAPSFYLNDSTTSLSNFIYSNLTYPANAEKLGISGQVRLKFVVELNGLPSNIVAEEYVGGGCTEEAIQLLEKTRWKPGQIDDKYVRTQHVVVITFQKGDHRGKHIPNQSNSGI